MKVFDCFMFHNEFDLLKIRLRELYDVVNHFILIEGDRTHTNKEKPFYFKENQHIFDDPKHKIISKQVNLPSVGVEPWFGWGREIFQRSIINDVLAATSTSNDDIVISGDVDEIPKIKVVTQYASREPFSIEPFCIEQKNFQYNLNCLLETPTIDPKICRYGFVKDMGVANLRYYHQVTSVPVIKDGGWHLSFMGGTNKVIEKMGSYAHYDVRDPNMATYMSRKNVEECIQSHKSLFLRNDIKYKLNWDFSDMPQYILENFQYFVNNQWLSS